MESSVCSIPEVSGDATRARLVAAGLQLFGSIGYDAVTTRRLAAQAEVNQAAIPYHFGGKRGVYLAVAQHLCDTTGCSIRQAVVRARVALVSEGAEAAHVLAEFIVSCVDVVVGREQGLLQYAFFVREQLSPSAAFDLIYDQILLPVHALVCDVLEALGQGGANAPSTMLLAESFLAQVSGFVTGRVLLQRRLDVDELDQVAVLDTVRRFTIAAVRGLQAMNTEKFPGLFGR
ncbi:CerR family C-terminal domain-containing protein [Azoarcus sp. L1K30]|uniref:CerR family C-terminal domain-containing protein n=1 Tax=Azoarcus sp. L1K30 TaxID=2820277 RepID=UPI001B82A6D1|nr:CerR family C-terminal domain-containing protein [Azoarcus sp. L1K30]MBR0566275.1 CerR family C-terminal domain-containing protein [Azoarcus sp. L1K30]